MSSLSSYNHNNCLTDYIKSGNSFFKISYNNCFFKHLCIIILIILTCYEHYTQLGQKNYIFIS